MKGAWRQARATAAAVLLDAPRYGLALRAPRLGRLIGLTWQSLCNRGETLARDPEQEGVRCEWRWTSSLRHCAGRQVGLRLLRAALAEWPVAFVDRPAETTGSPQVSFIIGHRGVERTPLLLAAIATIAAQEDTSVECIVVEQSVEPLLSTVLPSWVRHVHAAPPRRDMPYSRSWAFNVGARVSRGEWLVFHDNDILAPKRYGAELARLGASGYEAARLQRFVFYLDRDGSHRVLSTRSMALGHPPEQVVQNCEGHTLASKRGVYWAVGGHDEAFEGWGGEDNEMFDRLKTRRFHDCAYLPFVHLHHEPQVGKGAKHANTAYLERRMGVPAVIRVAELNGRPSGLLSGPVCENGVVSTRDIPA